MLACSTLNGGRAKGPERALSRVEIAPLEAEQFTAADGRVRVDVTSQPGDTYAAGQELLNKALPNRRDIRVTIDCLDNLGRRQPQ